MKLGYSAIYIIFNPKSTGSSVQYSRDLYDALKEAYSDQPIYLKQTKHAGHAEKLAYDCAKKSPKPLIISSSGDGGYHEVINGAMKAHAEGASPICAVLPAGNANDHSRTLQQKTLLSAIKSQANTAIDLLRITYSHKGKNITRYAHSYIGLGLTPEIAMELNKAYLNPFKEAGIVLKTFYKFKPFKVNIGSKALDLDSLIFTNIGKMAKVLTISKDAEADDGLFEVVAFPHSHKLMLMRQLIKAAFGGLGQAGKHKDFTFEVLASIPIQLDGEVSQIDANTEVRVESAKRLLQTVL